MHNPHQIQQQFAQHVPVEYPADEELHKEYHISVTQPELKLLKILNAPIYKQRVILSVSMILNYNLSKTYFLTQLVPTRNV